ncbi:caspase-2-like [Patiria miniata]|uniref:CARD domain-containing protein n=1 Tax=Patiria miniata TaxID=46514 RepID=A0A914AME7_PATMI|nr:caspase-2-like [Patiria miniata]XP_038064588.1 caspase-2-like [Patiria miniata]XP_038064596.1 caspase-2-like [Patiria miniata]XP_038064604.1 caspase-2-like [Patiria miniata]
MEDSDKRRLRRNRCALVDNIEPSRILDHLIECEVFTPDMCQDITSKSTTKEQTGKLLNMLEKRGCDAYRLFRNTLLKTDYEHLVEKLDTTPTADEVDAKAIKSPGQGQISSIFIPGHQKKQDAQHITNNVIGDNNFAVFGSQNLTINNYNEEGDD